MTLGSETAAVLMRAMDMLCHETSPAQHALLSTDERKSALQQLMATTEAAIKLAEVARLDALAGVERARAAPVQEETATLSEVLVRERRDAQPEAEIFGDDDAERVMREVEELRVVLEKAITEARAQASDAEIKWMVWGVEEARREAAGAMTENEREEAQLKSVSEELERTALDTENRLLELEKMCDEKVKAEADRVGGDLVSSVQEPERLRAVMDRVRGRKAMIAVEIKRLRADVDRVKTELWFQRVIKH